MIFAKPYHQCTITTEWHSPFRLPTNITEPDRITEFTYEVLGRLLERKVISG
jgi:hypothetical protein